MELLGQLPILSVAGASVFCSSSRRRRTGHEKNVRKTFRPILPAIRLTLAAGLAFTAATLIFQVLFNWLPQVLAGTAAMPPAWLIPLGHLNLLAHFCSLLLLTMAAAYACLLCTGKRIPGAAAEKTQAEG